MTDADDQRNDRPGRRPTPGASATSRARRIGGRPMPGGPRPAPRPATAPAAGRPETSSAETADPADPADPDVAAVNLPGVSDAGVSDAGVSDAEPRGEPAAAPGWLAWLPAALLAALAAVLLGFGVAASHGVWWAEPHVDVQHQRTEVLAAAKTCMATMNTYDYRKLDAAEKSGLACTTGKLTDQYRTAMEKLIKPQAAKVQFTQTAQVNSAGIESISKDGAQWTVLIFGQLSTTNSQTGSNAPKLSIFSARVTMQRSNGHWLVANYEYAPTV